MTLESSITWINHFKQYFQTSLRNVLMNMWQNPKYVPVSCRNIIKFYNNGMDGVDIMDKNTAAYRLDHKSKYCFYLNIFFDLADVIFFTWNLVMTYRLFDISNDIWHIKIIVAKALIGRYSNRSRSFSTTRLSKWKSNERSMNTEVPTRMSEFQ